jgi:hypothetical protein
MDESPHANAINRLAWEIKHRAQKLETRRDDLYGSPVRTAPCSRAHITLKRASPYRARQGDQPANWRHLLVCWSPRPIRAFADIPDATWDRDGVLCPEHAAELGAVLKGGALNEACKKGSQRLEVWPPVLSFGELHRQATASGVHNGDDDSGGDGRPSRASCAAFPFSAWAFSHPQRMPG